MVHGQQTDPEQGGDRRMTGVSVIVLLLIVFATPLQAVVQLAAFGSLSGWQVERTREQFTSLTGQTMWLEIDGRTVLDPGFGLEVRLPLTKKDKWLLFLTVHDEMPAFRYQSFEEYESPTEHWLTSLTRPRFNTYGTWWCHRWLQVDAVRVSSLAGGIWYRDILRPENTRWVWSLGMMLSFAPVTGGEMFAQLILLEQASYAYPSQFEDTTLPEVPFVLKQQPVSVRLGVAIPLPGLTRMGEGN